MAPPIAPPPGFEMLSPEEKIAYVQALWDLIASKPEDVPVPAWQRAIIDERLAEARSTTTPTKAWSEARTELQARLKSARG